MLLELDGCEIRTGVYMTAAQAGLADRPARQQVRVENWRDVRTGLARPLTSKEPRLYVCRLDSYDEVCEQLFGVACAQGLTPRSQVVVPGDGAKGLREAVLVAFPKAQYILDPPISSRTCMAPRPPWNWRGLHVTRGYQVIWINSGQARSTKS